MSVRFVNRAKMGVASAPGAASPLSLGSASAGYQSFAAAGVLDGNVVRYTIEDGAAWEIGTGVYTAAGTTLTRVVEESSNAGAAINASATAEVFVTAAAYDLQVRPEIVFALTGTTPNISPGNGTIQTWTLTGASTPTVSMADGESVTLMINSGTSFSITWPTINWVGGTAPTLTSTGFSVIVLWKIGNTIYGKGVGDA